MIRVFKTKPFGRWARKARIADSDLIDAVDEIESGLIDADLGGGLLKKRVARSGRGKRGGYRTLIAFKQDQRAFFVFGFSKKDRENIDDQEEKIYKNLAHYYLNQHNFYLEKMILENELIEVSNEKD